MKTLISLLFSIVCVPCVTFAIEPVGTIGQPYPERHTFHSDGTILRAVQSHIQIVHPNTGAVLDEFGERTRISEVVFSPTSAQLAIMNYHSDSKATTVEIWDVKAREQITQWEVAARIDVATFSPTAVLFATSFDNEIHLWNWKTGKSVGTMAGGRRPSRRCDQFTCASSPRDNALVFTPDGRHLMVGSQRPDVELWNVETRRLVGHLEGHPGGWVDNVAISPDGRFVATVATYSRIVHVWDVKTQQLRWRETSGIGRVSGLAFSPDSQRLYVATATSGPTSSGTVGMWTGWDDMVRIWDVESGQQIDEFGDEFRQLNSITLSPDEETMLLHYRDAVVLWDIETAQRLSVWADFVVGIFALSPDGKTFVSASSYYIKIWNLPSGQLRHMVSAEGGLFRKFAISSDGQKLAVGRDPWIQIRSLQTGEVETQLWYTYGHSDIAYSSSGRWVAANGYGQGNILLLNVEEPERNQTAMSEDAPNLTSYPSVYHIAFSDNDQYLTASLEERILLWKRDGDAFTFQFAWELEKEQISHSRLSFATLRGGSVLLAIPVREGVPPDVSEYVKIWELNSNSTRLLATLDVSSPAYFSSNGLYLYGSRNDRLQIWDWQKNTPIDHPPVPSYFALSRDGTILLSWDKTGQIQIWDGTALLPSDPVSVEQRGRKFLTLGQIKQNRLLQNYPNPFNPETWIPFRVANESNVTIRIYTSTGKLIRVLSPGVLPAGEYRAPSRAVYWDGCNESGESVSSGIYLYNINAGEFSATRKMIIQK